MFFALEDTLSSNQRRHFRRSYAVTTRARALAESKIDAETVKKRLEERRASRDALIRNIKRDFVTREECKDELQQLSKEISDGFEQRSKATKKVEDAQDARKSFAVVLGD